MRRVLGLKPMLHQAECSAKMLENLRNNGSFAVLHGLGSGKTLTTLGSFLQLVNEGEARSLFVAAPSSVVSAWQRDIRLLATKGIDVDVLPLTQNGSAKRAAALQRRLLERAGMRDVRPFVVLLNYESTFRLQDDLVAAGFDMVVCDESQRIKDPGTRQSKAMYQIGKRARFRVILSGTPIPEGVAGWFSQFKFLDDSVFGKSKINYESRFMTRTMVGPQGRQFPIVKENPRMMPELERIVMNRAHMVRTEDVIELQGQSFVPVEVELSAKGRKLYDQMEKESIALLEEANGDFNVSVADIALTRLTRLQQITSGFLRDEDGNDHDICDAKQRALEDLLITLREEGRKAVVFYRWRRDGENIERIARKVHKGIEPCVIHGGVATNQRDDIIHRFQHGDAQVFVAQIRAAGLGIDLFAASDDIYFSTGYSCEQFEQSSARTYRNGQTKHVTHHLIQCVNTIDPGVFEDLMAKRDAQKRFIDSGWQRALIGS